MAPGAVLFGRSAPSVADGAGVADLNTGGMDAAAWAREIFGDSSSSDSEGELLDEVNDPLSPMDQ